jgi:hypothetical protein
MKDYKEKAERYELDSDLALYEEVSETNETLESISTKMDSIVTELKKPEKEYPKVQDVRVINPNKIEFPTTFDIKEPSWFSFEGLYRTIGMYIGSAVDELKAFTFKVQVVEEKEEYGKVTLVDEKGKPLKILEAILSSSKTTQKQDDVKYFQSFPESMVVTVDPTSPIATGQAYATQIDDVSTSGITYIGKALVGTGTASPLWQIQKVNQNGTPITTVITWAGNAKFNQIWDNRTSLTYV